MLQVRAFKVSPRVLGGEKTQTGVAARREQAVPQQVAGVAACALGGWR